MLKKETPGVLTRRWIAMFIGLVILSYGIALSIKANLGTTAVSSLPYVLSLITPLTVGQLSIMLHCTCFLLQIAILRRDFERTQFLQLPSVIVFGYVTDFALWTLEGLTYSNYLQQCILCALGIIFVGAGVSCVLATDTTIMSVEGLTLVLSKKLKIKFGTMKVIGDCFYILCAMLISYSFLGQINGVREGTVAAALLVGTVSGMTAPFAKKLTDKFIAVSEA